jgi:hypothetical protein
MEPEGRFHYRLHSSVKVRIEYFLLNLIILVIICIKNKDLISQKNLLYELP